MFLFWPDSAFVRATVLEAHACRHVAPVQQFSNAFNGTLLAQMLSNAWRCCTQRPVTWSDAWFHTFWRFMGPRTDKYFADCKAKLFSSAPLAGGF